MTDLRVTVSILFLVVLVGWIGNLFQVAMAYGDYRAVHRQGLNGPRALLAMAELRRHVSRFFMQSGLLWLARPRTFLGQSVSPVGAFVVYFVLAVLLTAETIADAIDRYELRWFLRGKS